MTATFTIENKPGYTVFHFAGFIDAATTELARHHTADKLPDDCADIIVDLQHVDFIDSHGVGFFVSLLKKAHANGGRLVFAGAAGQPAAVLNMVGFNATLVNYCATLPQARRMINARRMN